MINHPAILCFPANCATSSCTSTQGSASMVGKGSPVAWAQPLTTAAQDSQFYLSSTAGGGLLLSASATPHWLAEDKPVIGYLRQKNTLNFKTLNTGFLISVFPIFFFNLEEHLLKKHEIDHIFTLKQSKGGRNWGYKPTSTLWKVKTFNCSNQSREQKEGL